MKRFAAQYLLLDIDKWLRNRVIEQNDDLCLTAIYNLSEMQAETAHTLFYDGIISLFPLQLPSEIEPDHRIIELLKSLTDNHHSRAIDGSIYSQLSDRLNTFSDELRLLSGSDFHLILKQCIFTPLKITDNYPQIVVGQYPVLVLWQNIDLKALKLTSSLQIKLISPSF